MAQAALKEMTPLEELFYAIKHNDRARLTKLFQDHASKKGQLLVHTTPGGDTPLRYAAREGHAAIIKALLLQGAPIDARASDGVTALMIAAYHGHTEVATMLITAESAMLSASGARVTTKEQNGLTALMFASLNGHTPMVRTLLAAKARIDATCAFGQTPLLLAARRGHESTVKHLVKAGARAVVEGVENTTAVLVSAADSGHASIVSDLVTARADVNHRNRGGRTALMVASCSGQTATVRTLLELGASRTKKQGGMTALEWAQSAGHMDVAVLLSTYSRTGGRLQEDENAEDPGETLAAAQLIAGGAKSTDIRGAFSKKVKSNTRKVQDKKVVRV
jgi:ankyrin repeat protein